VNLSKELGTSLVRIKAVSLGRKRRFLAGDHQLLSLRFGGRGEMNMKKLIISTLATALVVSFAVSAEAAGNKQKVSADIQASCKAQVAKKYSAIHFLKRRNFVNNCVAQHDKASAPKAAKPTTTGQAPKQSQ
jgi:hypothetical protein